MSKTSLAVGAVALAAICFGLGHAIASRSAQPPGPPPPRSPEEVALAKQRMGEIMGILHERNPNARIRQLSDALSKLGPDALPEVIEVIREGEMAIGGAEADLLVRFWASHDPKTAADWARVYSPYRIRVIAIEASIEAAAHADPEVGMAIVEEYGRSPVDTQALAYGALMRGWFDSGRPGIEGYLASLPPDRPQQRAFSELIRHMIVRNGVAAVVEWLEQLEDLAHEFKATAFRRAMPEIFTADRQLALEWCQRSCFGPYGRHLAAILAREWAKKEGPAALQWTSTLPAGKERDQAVLGAFTAWRQVNGRELLAWVSELDPKQLEPWLLPIVEQTAMWKAWDYPLVAYDWAALIEDPERRELAMISITRRWREADEAGAEAWLEQSPLSEEARAKAREFPPGFRGRGKRPFPPQDFPEAETSPEDAS